MITYPVNPEGRFTFKLHGDVKRGKLWPRSDGMQLEGKDPSLIVLEEFVSELPAFDPATQKLSDGDWIDDEANQAAIFVRTVLQLTQAEIDAKTQAEADEAERQLMLSQVPSLKAGTGTQAERLQRCEKGLARVITDLWG